MLNSTPRVIEPDFQEVAAPTLREVFDVEESPLLRFACSLVRQREVAEEIVQEAFLQLHIRWDEVETPRAWLFQTVRNRAFDFIRAHRCEPNGDSELDGNDSDERQESPDQQLQRREAVGVLSKLVDELQETAREIVQLKYFGGFRYREISEQTQLSVGNVGYRMHHILKGLASRLRQLGIDEIS